MGISYFSAIFATGPLPDISKALGKERAHKWTIRVSNLPSLKKPIFLGLNEKTTAAHRHLRLVAQSSTSAEQEDIWILLTRHQSNNTGKTDYIALHVHDEDEHRLDIHKIAEKVRKYICIIHVQCLNDSFQARFTSSIHVLARTRIPKGRALSILASYDGPFEEVGFTLSAYTSSAITWDKTISQPPFMHQVRSPLLLFLPCFIFISFRKRGPWQAKMLGETATSPLTWSIHSIIYGYIQRRRPLQGQLETNAWQKRTWYLVVRCQGRPRSILPSFGPKANGYWSAIDIVLLTVMASWLQLHGRLAQKEIASSSGPYGYGFVRADRQLQRTSLVMKNDLTMLTVYFSRWLHCHIVCVRTRAYGAIHAHSTKFSTFWSATYSSRRCRHVSKVHQRGLVCTLSFLHFTF